MLSLFDTIKHIIIQIVLFHLAVEQALKNICTGEVSQTDNEYQYLLYPMSASLGEFSYTCSACKFFNNRQQKYKNNLCLYYISRWELFFNLSKKIFDLKTAFKQLHFKIVFDI